MWEIVRVTMADPGVKGGGGGGVRGATHLSEIKIVSYDSYHGVLLIQ